MPLVEIGFPGGVHGSGRDQLVAHGPTIWVDVGLDPEFNYNGQGRPMSQVSSVPALVDTGALESCIDDALAQKIGLPLIDKANVSGAGGSHELNIYFAHIFFPAFGMHQWGRFAGVKLSDGNQVHQALIGRTVLQSMLMIYDGRTGAVTLAL